VRQVTRLFGIAAALATVADSVGPVHAQDKKAIVAAQKETVLANLKKADLGKLPVVETEHFFVTGRLTEDRAKALGGLLEKVAPIARKALEYDPKDEVWKGKLAVYYLPESRDFKIFMRAAVMVKPEGVYYDVRADAPNVVDPVDVPASGKVTEADQFANTVAVVAAAYLKAKGSTAAMPSWLETGFGRITALRAEGANSKRFQTYKTQAKALVTGGKQPAAALADLWGESKAPNAELLATSVVDYMAYGPGAGNLVKLVYGFRPDENGNVPSVAQAMEAAGWKETGELEKAWQAWVLKGK
jgi:hypothetical protein